MCDKNIFDIWIGFKKSLRSFMARIACIVSGRNFANNGEYRENVEKYKFRIIVGQV